MSSEGSQTSLLISPDNIQQPKAKKTSGGRPKSSVWDNHIKQSIDINRCGYTVSLSIICISYIYIYY